MKRQYPEHQLYLAVPLDVSRAFFGLEFTQDAIAESRVSLLVYDTELEVINLWQE